MPTNKYINFNLYQSIPFAMTLFSINSTEYNNSMSSTIVTNCLSSLKSYLLLLLSSSRCTYLWCCLIFLRIIAFCLFSFIIRCLIAKSLFFSIMSSKQIKLYKVLYFNHTLICWIPFNVKSRSNLSTTARNSLSSLDNSITQLTNY